MKLFGNIARYITAKWIILRGAVGTPMLVLSGALSLFVVYTVVHDWRTDSAIEEQSKRVEQYSRESRLAAEKANEFLSRADANRAETISMLELVKTMSGNIQKLAEKDRMITVEVKNLKNDYENARTQTRTNSIRIRPNRTLRQRENDVLAADRELYK